MEERILERTIENLKASENLGNDYIKMYRYELPALENLLTRYKELENELNQLNNYILINGIDERLKTATQIKIENYSEFLHQKRVERLEERIKELKENSIPKSKIKEIIEKHYPDEAIQRLIELLEEE